MEIKLSPSADWKTVTFSVLLMTYTFLFKSWERCLFFFQTTNILSNCFVYFYHLHWSMNSTEVGISLWLVCDSTKCYLHSNYSDSTEYSYVQEVLQSFLKTPVYCGIDSLGLYVNYYSLKLDSRHFLVIQNHRLFKIITKYRKDFKCYI